MQIVNSVNRSAIVVDYDCLRLAILEAIDAASWEGSDSIAAELASILKLLPHGADEH